MNLVIDNLATDRVPRGVELLHDSRLNKSTAFSASERAEHGRVGLLPPAVETLDRQVERCLMQLGKNPNNLERYIYLPQWLDADETLFFKLMMSDPARFLPILYALCHTNPPVREP